MFIISIISNSSYKFWLFTVIMYIINNYYVNKQALLIYGCLDLTSRRSSEVYNCKPDTLQPRSKIRLAPCVTVVLEFIAF